MSWANRLSNLLRRRDLNPDIDEELQFHVNARIGDNLAAGMTDDEARRDAYRRFGSRPAAREQTRDANVFVTLETIAQDLSYAARSLRKRPGFTVVALLTLALGIGANTSIFTLVNSVLIRPLPFPESDSLHIISYAPKGQSWWLYPGLGDSDYLSFQPVNRVFEAMTTFAGAPATLTGAGDAVRVAGATVTPDFFRVFRVTPIVGRAFGPEDGQPGRDKVALITDGLWQRRFGANPNLVNRAITLDGVEHTVIGILPPEFSYPAGTEVWTPLVVRLAKGEGWWRPVIGRLRPETTRAQAQAAFETFAKTLPRDPKDTRPWLAQVTPLRDAVAADSRESLLIFAGAVALVLLIACANVSNLLLMRAVSRRQEIATRLALGASRGRIVRQLLTESVLLSLLGGAAGVLLAALGVPALLALIPVGRLPRITEVHIDGWVLAGTLGVSTGIGVLMGLAPAFQASREQLAGVFRAGVGVGSRWSYRLRRSLVIAEVALATVLLISAGLLVKSLVNLRAVDPGFQPERVMTMVIDLPRSRYPSPVEIRAFHERVLTSLSTLPNVVAAGAVNWRPFDGNLIRGDAYAEGRERPPELSSVAKACISAGYFRAMGIRIRTGRDFTDLDHATAEGVAIVSASLAHLAWPNERAIGKRITLEDNPKPEDWLTVVAIVDDVKQRSLTQRVIPTVYQPYEQTRRRGFISYMSFAVRTAGNPRDVAPAMRDVLRAVDQDQAPQAMTTMEHAVDGTIAEPRFQTRLLALFSTLAVFLAAIGIYGVLSSSVAERRREIGIRVALGANKARVARMVLRQTMLLAGLGLAIGVAGALAFTRLLRTLLFEVAPTDAATFVVASVVLGAVALIAGLIPAWRASAVDPLVTLKTE